MSFHRLALASLLLLCLGADLARAQPMGEVVVVPFGAGELEGALGATTALEAQLLDERVSLIPLHDARDRFTARSRPRTRRASPTSMCWRGRPTMRSSTWRSGAQRPRRRAYAR